MLKNQLKSTLCVLLSVVLAVSICVPALAEHKPFGYFGDPSKDGVVDAADALLVLKFAVGKQEFDDAQKQSGNTNGDSVVDAADALEILKFAVGKLSSWSVDKTAAPNPEDFYVAYEQSDFAYNTSFSVNGAYANDSTADCSFIMDNTGLDNNTVYTVAPTAADTPDKARLLYSLQGLINRDFGRDNNHTTMLYINNETQDINWLNVMMEEGTVLEGYTKVSIRTWDDFYATFEKQIQYCGIVLWDGNVPATANVAATICGLDGYLPVLAKSPLHDDLKAKGIEEKQTLVDLFANGHKGQKIVGTNISSTGSAKNDAYLWAIDKYFYRCSANYLAYTLDGACSIKGYEAYEDNPTALLKDARSNCLSNHDYLIARRCFFFDLCPYKEDDVCDDPAQQSAYHVTCKNCNYVNSYNLDTVLNTDPTCADCGSKIFINIMEVKPSSLADKGIDTQTMLKLFDLRYQRAKGGMGQLMGFPPWWLKYTNYSEQGTKAPTWIEWLFTEYLSCYNLAKEADAAHPSSMTNGSAYYKYVPSKASYDNNWEEYYQSQGFKFDKNVNYYTIYVGDYDSSAWMKLRVHDWFVKNGGDRARQDIPLTWCFNPNLSNRIPVVFDYVYNHKYEHEFVAAGDSGAGYVIPSGLVKDTKLSYTKEGRPSYYASGEKVWADYCAKFYQRFDMAATGFIINGGNELSKNILDMYNQFSTRGSLHNRSQYLFAKQNGVPYVYCHNGIDEGTTMDVLYDHVVSGMGDYNFAAFRTICRSPSQIQSIVENFNSYAKGKGLNVQYVELNTFLQLAKESGQGETVR